MGLYKENRIEDYWKTSDASTKLPIYPIIRLITYDRMHLLQTRIRVAPAGTTGPYEIVRA